MQLMHVSAPGAWLDIQPLPRPATLLGQSDLHGSQRNQRPALPKGSTIHSPSTNSGSVQGTTPGGFVAVLASKINTPCVLVADDYLPNLVVIEAILQPQQVATMKASTAEEAVRMASQHAFSAILLDVRMGEMGGIEAANLIRAGRSNGRTPIVFLTGAEPDKAELNRLSGPRCDVLLKPFTASSLLDKIVPFLASQSEQSGEHPRRVPQAVLATGRQDGRPARDSIPSADQPLSCSRRTSR